MIEPVFNEFSAYPLCDNDAAGAKFHTLASLIKHLEVYGIKKVRYENNLADIPFTKDKSLGEYCNEILCNRNTTNASTQNEVYMLYGRIKPPFIKDDESFEPGDIAQATCTYETVNSKGESEMIEADAVSLLSAYLLETFSIGFDNNTETPFKLKLKYKESKDSKIQTVEKEVSVICVCTEEDCSTNKDFIDLLSNQADLQVKKADVKELNFTLPGHHGTKECKEHGKELLRLDYVKAILSSRAFNSGEKKYIHKINPDGSIEVRLYWTEDGYGLLISTSAENIVQAHWIAKYLNDRYGK